MERRMAEKNQYEDWQKDLDRSHKRMDLV
jgi:hypothetical protein